MNKRILSIAMLSILLIMTLLPSCSGRKAKSCPAFQEGVRTGGTIDKNKKRKKVKQGVFDKKVRRRYNR